VLVALGYAFSTWALIENRFFSGVVRIQTERDHRVCDSGPYRVVRHPGYAGHLLALPGLILGLASVWTILPALLALAVIFLRTSLEDRVLWQELPGYREYAQRTRFQLIPWFY
jgi:protein-S-isoprenylcysteine O-methyltransferase Ste14